MALNNKKYCSNELDGDRPLRLEHRFLVLRKLGQGTYGKVQLALNKETNEEVAVKTIKKAKIENEEDMLRIRREIHIMTALRHPNIIHIHEVFETRQKIVIVMQYASGGELYDYLGCHQTLPEAESRRIFRQIASAIYYCHKNKICHRDLKLENILLDDEGNAQIADFGLSNMFDDKRRMNTFCGSPLYASPEIVKGTPYKGPEVDCWSLGVLLYTLVYGTMPFDGRSFKELVSQISEGRYEEPVHKSNASSLIRWLLTPDITRRATITDVCKDSWVNDGYNTSLLEIAENMALAAGLHREQIRATKLCLETNNKNGSEKSLFKKAATQLEEKAGKFTSFFTKNLENAKTNDTIQHTRKNSFYEQITNYDVRFVINKLLAAVEASLIAEKYSQSTSKHNILNIQNAKKREETTTEKIDSAYIIPIFEVTSVIPNERIEIQNAVKNPDNKNAIPKMSLKSVISKSEKARCDQTVEKKDIILDSANRGRRSMSEIEKKPSKVLREKHKILSTETSQHSQTLLTDSQKPYYSLNMPGQSELLKGDTQTRSMQHEHSFSRHPSQKNKRLNDSVPFNQKQPGPFMKTKHHVLTLARILSLNYERIMRNSFRMPACKKKPPGKITIPPTFDPNNPLPTVAKKQQEEKKELLIFPTVSVSENKEKIQKKIEKIKKAALDKNIIIRSDSKTRIRIEKYIRSQVKKIQDLVREEQRSLQASLEHLDEQSLRDMSEMYYCAFGSENTDSGIANTEDEEYFCFICSKPNTENGTPGIVDSFILESIKKGCLYTSNHLHVPRGKEPNKWGYTSNNNNMEFGSLSRCKSEIKLASDYLNYISPNKKSDLSKRTQTKQQLQARNIGNIKCFFTVPATTKSDDSDFRILRSASDSAGLNLSKNTFDVVKLNNESHDDVYQNYKLLPHFLEHATSNRCNYSQATEYETQSCATDATFMNTSQMLEKDDGIGDSNDSFQSYIETLDNNAESDPALFRSMSSHSYMNFTKDALNNQRLPATLLSKSHLKHKYESENDNLRRPTDLETNIADALDSISWITALEKESELLQQTEKSKGLRRRNTMSCLPQNDKPEESSTNDQCSTEFENYLWSAYKEHLLENNQNDSEYSSSPNLNYYSLDRKSKFKSRDSKSMDYVNGDRSTDFLLKQFSNFASTEYDSNEDSSSIRKSTLKHSNAAKTLPGRSGSRLSRIKSACSEALTDGDRDDIIRRLREDRKLSLGSSTLDASSSSRSPLLFNHINDLERKDQRRKVDGDSNRRRYSKTNLPLNKRTKSEYKKSFLQLLALKRIQEAEKELNKNPRNELPNVEEENSGSLLEALKTHGYKNVISQRFQDTDDDDDFLDPFNVKYLKSPRNLRAELARLNYMYYESLPRYTLDPYEENDYFYDDLDYTRNFLNGLAMPSHYDMVTDFRPQAKRSVYDWLDTTQFDTLRSDSLYIPEEEASTSERRKCCTQWSRENYRSFDDESTSESQDTIEETSSNNTLKGYSKSRDLGTSHEPNFGTIERSQTSAINTDDESQESVHDRIWRKSFYSRFNNRALSRKERLSFIEPHSSESRLGQLNNLYSNPLKTGYEKSELSQWDGSNKSFHMKRSKKLSSSYDKFNSRTSLKNKLVKTAKEKEITLSNEETSSSKKFTEACNTNENEEPEH